MFILKQEYFSYNMLSQIPRSEILMINRLHILPEATCSSRLFCSSCLLAHHLIGLVCFILFNGFFHTAQAQFAFSIGNSGFDIAYEVAIDQSGNVFMTGAFSGTADFDASANSLFLESMGGDNTFLASYTAEGDLRFAFNFGALSQIDESGTAVGTDDEGNVYIAGRFGGTVDFNPGPEVHELVGSVTSRDFFVASYTSEGIFRYAIHQPTNGFTSGPYMTVDGRGNVFLYGTAIGTIDLDPGPEEFEISVENGLYGFLSSYDSSGQFRYGFSPGSVQSSSLNISLDSEENIYLLGAFSGRGDFDPGLEVSELNSATGGFYIASYQNDGTFVNAFNMGSPSAIRQLLDITVDYMGNSYVAGFLNGSMDMAPGPDTLTVEGASDALLASYDPSGNVRFVWILDDPTSSLQERLTNNSSGVSLTTDSGGNVLLAGIFIGTVDFDPGTGTHNMETDATDDFFISQYTPDGEFYTAFSMQVNNRASFIDIEVNPENNLFLTGSFAGTMSFDAGLGIEEISSYTATGEDIFLLARSAVDVSIEEPTNELNTLSSLIQNYPNPFSTETTIEYRLSRGSHVSLEVFDILGRRVDVLVDAAQYAGSYQIRWKPLNLTSGVYFSKLETAGQIEMKKIIFQH